MQSTVDADDAACEDANLKAISIINGRTANEQKNIVNNKDMMFYFLIQCNILTQFSKIDLLI